MSETCDVDGCRSTSIGTLNGDNRCRNCMEYDLEEGNY